jgi:flagellar motility protein MotE (MotC chaperone)
MKRKGHFAIGVVLLVGLLTILSLKLLMTTGNLMSHYKGLRSFLSVPEVLATDQKKNLSKPGENATRSENLDQVGKKAPEGEPLRTARSATPSSAETLAHLEQRELELKRKEQNLQEQEQHLMQMQKEVEQKLEELIAIQKEIQSFRSEKSETKNASIRSLAQIYGTMKPKEAAKLLENMDEKLVVNLLSTMKSNEAAEILSIMDFKKAAKISEALTQR